MRLTIATSGDDGRIAARSRLDGQAMTEFALIFPTFVLVLFSIIVFGLYVFYNQQLANAAREAARYAAVHSASAQCPTVSRLDPILTNQPSSYVRCDTPQAGWPRMTAAGRRSIWGMAPNLVQITACWSGFVDPVGNHDALPNPPNTFVDCTIGGLAPHQNLAALPCPPPAPVLSTASPPGPDGDDKASATAFVNGVHYQTTVTVYACFRWNPPMAGFLLIPSEVTLRALVTEALHRQQ